VGGSRYFVVRTSVCLQLEQFCFLFLFPSFSFSFYLFLLSSLFILPFYFPFLPFSALPLSLLYLLLSPFLNFYPFFHLSHFPIPSFLFCYFCLFQISFLTLYLSFMFFPFCLFFLFCPFLILFLHIFPSRLSLLISFPFLPLFSLLIRNFSSFMPYCIFQLLVPLCFLVYSPVFLIVLPPSLTRPPKPRFLQLCESVQKKLLYLRNSLFNSKLHLFALF
jgi:hypothetical protein